MMRGQQVGYIRVSSILQNTDRQLVDVELDKVFTDKVSGKDVKRKGLQDCLNHLREDDTLHIHSIDRLGRNLADIQNIVTELIERKVSVHFHKEHLIFNSANDAFSKLMLQMLGAFSEFERNLIKERQREGIAIAQKNGVKFGRKSKLNEEQTEELRNRASSGEDKTSLAKEYCVSRQTIYNIINA